jgi:hypothetical protein
MWWGVALIVGGLFVGLSICGIFGETLELRKTISVKTAAWIVIWAFVSIVVGIIITLVGGLN